MATAGSISHTPYPVLCTAPGVTYRVETGEDRRDHLPDPRLGIKSVCLYAELSDESLYLDEPWDHFADHISIYSNRRAIHSKRDV